MPSSFSKSTQVSSSSVWTLMRKYSKLHADALHPTASILNLWFNLIFKEYPADLDRPDTILFDLGVSMFHFESSGRGFSLMRDEPLDMRLSDDLETSAADIVNDYPEAALAKILYEYGEEGRSRKIARTIVGRRQRSRIETTGELAEIVATAIPPQYRHGRIHPATRTFQALRIAVNGELVRLDAALSAAIGVLRVGGRIGVISFHSLEDRIVKNTFRERNKECTCPQDQPICNCGGRRILEVLTKKPVTAGEDEIGSNPASRSAKLRVAVKIAEEEAR